MPLQEVLNRSDTSTHLVHMPRLGAQVAQALHEKAELFTNANALGALEKLVQILSQNYCGVTCAHAPLLAEYLRMTQYDKATHLCDNTELADTDFVGHMPCLVNFSDFINKAGFAYFRMEAYDKALRMWETEMALPFEHVHSSQMRAMRFAILVRLLRDGSIAPLHEMLPLCGMQIIAAYEHGCETYLHFARVYAEYTLNSHTELAQFVAANRENFAKDGTFECVELCLGVRPQHTIRKLAHMYKTLPLAHIASFLGVREHEAQSALEAVKPSLQNFTSEFDWPAELRAVPVPGGVLDMDPGRVLVHFDQPIKQDKQALDHVLTKLVAAEKRAAPALQAELSEMLTSHDVLSRIISFHAGSTLSASADDPDDEFMIMDT